MNASGIWRWLERITLTAAVAGVGYWAVVTEGPDLWQKWANRQFEQRGQNIADAGDDANTNKPVAAPKKRDVIGRLAIPRLDMNVIVREGADDKTLGLSAGHIPGTALPGENGNLAIAAHRDTLFRALAHVQQNDVIRLDDTEGRSYYYQVGLTQVVEPTEMSVLKSHSTRELTLVTCYPFNYVGSAPNRFIVKAWAISEKAAAGGGTSGPASSVPARLETSPAKPGPMSPTRAARLEAIPYRDPEASRKTYFTVYRDHSRKLAEGVSLGITDIDADNQQVEGWLWLMPERRTVWLRSHAVGAPLPLEPEDAAKKREVVITKVSGDSVTGYLVN